MGNKIKVCWITCTKGRHSLLERSVRMFLDQDYENKLMIIYNNSDVKQELDQSLLDKNIILVNRYIDSKTGEPYKTLGAIYNDVLQYIPDDVELINHADDDDIFLPNHLTEGVEGYVNAIGMNMLAYKPKFSYYHHAGGIARMCNVMEPSIFIDADHIRKHGYYDNTNNQHHKWLSALGDNVLVEEDGKSTLIYDWNNEVPVWKTSGDPDNPQNFDNYTANSNDHGDYIIKPIDTQTIEKYYNLVDK